MTSQASSKRSPLREAVATVRVRYAETDKMGIVYYANYFVWFEVGRAELLRSMGWTYVDMEKDGHFLPVIAATCEYRQSARYDDALQVHTTGTLLSPVRLEFRYRVVRIGDDTIVAEGHTVHAAVDTNGRLCRLPDRVRAFFS
jgi:acyl-CoA thioester hydrolase